MKKLLVFIILLLSEPALSNEDCTKVELELPNGGSLYVLCENLSDIKVWQAHEIINKVFSQRKGPPDETLVYFVKTSKAIGKEPVPDNELSAYYYTHNNEFVIFSDKPTKIKYKLSW